MTNRISTAASLVLMGILAGCGGSNDNGGGPSSTAAPTTAPPTTAAPTTTTVAPTTVTTTTLPAVVLENGEWSITLSTPTNTVFCAFYTSGPHKLNFSQAPGTGNLSGTTRTPYTYRNPTTGVTHTTTATVVTSGTVAASGIVNLVYTVSLDQLPPTTVCNAGTFFSQVQITITNGQAAAAPPNVRRSINGGAYMISAQGNTQAGSVTAFTNP